MNYESKKSIHKNNFKLFIHNFAIQKRNKSYVLCFDQIQQVNFIIYM